MCTGWVACLLLLSICPAFSTAMGSGKDPSHKSQLDKRQLVRDESCLLQVQGHIALASSLSEPVVHTDLGVRVVLAETEDEDSSSDIGSAASSAPLLQTLPSGRFPRVGEVSRWYPTSVHGGPNNEVFVQLSSFSNKEHPLLLKKDKRALNRGSRGQHRVLSLEQFRKEAESIGMNNTGPIFLQFKVARCGSTLLDNMLAKDPRFLLVAEPGVLNMVARALPNDDSETRELRRQLFRALIMHMAMPLTKEQQVVMFDLNSQTSEVMGELAQALPEAHSFLLWRNPIEVGDSLLGKPPGWLRLRSSDESSTVHGIRRHLEMIANTYNSSCAGEEALGCALKVFWYQQVSSGTLLKWILRKAFRGQELAHTNFKEMMSVVGYNSKTGESFKGFDHDELKAPSILKKMGAVWYNPQLVHFKTQHPPVSSELEFDNLKRAKVLHWPKDAVTIEKHLKGHYVGTEHDQPIVVRNALASTGLAHLARGEAFEKMKESLSLRQEHVKVLQAEKENLFVWHSPKRLDPSRYHVCSKWGDALFEDFEKDPKLQIIDKLDPRLEDQLHNEGSVLLTLESRSPHGFKKHASLRISHEGATTAMHFDRSDSTLMQLEGAKEILFFPPDELANLYPYPHWHSMHRRTLADPEYLDPELLPNFNVSTAQLARLNRTDLAFWPSMWAHYIRTVEGPSVSVGRRTPPPQERKESRAEVSSELISKVEDKRFAKGFSVVDPNSNSNSPASFSQILSSDDDDDDHSM